MARRPFAAGEAFTVDYATFCGPELTAFPSRCATAPRRGTIRGTDCLRPELRVRYGDHVSDYVRSCAAARTPPGCSSS